MMNINKILEKYWAAETSLEEEKQLHQYFKSENISEEHRVFQSLFGAYQQEKGIELSHPFERANILPKEKGAKILSLRTISIAASVLLALAVVFNSYNDKQDQQSNIVVIDTPEEALAYTKNALALVSSSLNRGTQSMVKGMKPLSKASILIK